MTLIPSIIKKQSQDGSIDDGVVTILFWARSQTLRRRSGALFWSLFLGRRRTFREGKDFLYGTAATSTAREADLVVCCAFQCYYTELSSHYYSMLHFFFAFPQTFVAFFREQATYVAREETLLYMYMCIRTLSWLIQRNQHPITCYWAAVGWLKCYNT